MVPFQGILMFGIGPVQIVIVMLIILLLFGSRLPSVARSLGLSITEFKKGMKGIEDQSSTSSSKDDSA